MTACESRSFPLAGGTLAFDIAETTPGWSLDSLCAAASRDNPRRRFLIVSKVLGRHLPARPSEMRRSMRNLAERIPSDLPQPTLVVGLAETAVGLGQGVYEELTRLGIEGCYLHTTRQQVEAPLLCRFDEPHSHAALHLIYRPSFDLAAFRSLVLVDDEISTGTTLANLRQALLPALPRVERVILAALTDWSGGGASTDRTVALVSGRVRWTADEAPAATDASAGAKSSFGGLPAPPRHARGGISRPRDVPRYQRADLMLPTGRAVRVVGTGEFTYPPFLLAESLEAEGRDVVVQAATRSPALVSGALFSKLSFADNYGADVPNYLYNVEPESDERACVLCCETGAASLDPVLVRALCAIPLAFT